MKEQSRLKFDVRDIIIKHLERVREVIKVSMDANHRNASFAHVRSLQIEADSNYGVLWGLETFPYVETGGGRWRKQYAFPPLWFRNIIRQWIIDKGIAVRQIPYKNPNRPHKYSVAERSLLSAAGAISMSIMRNGTQLAQTHIRQDIYSWAITRECEKIADEARMSVGDIIQNINKDI